MNLIVSGDQHIKVAKDIPLEWQLNRYRELWQSYVNLCQQHKAELILTGDLFHNAKPTLHEIMLALELFALLEANEIYTHIISGNHENMGAAGTTLDYFSTVFKQSSYLQYWPEIGFVEEGGARLYFVGHNRLQEWIDTSNPEWKGTRIIFSHFRPTVNQFIQEEIDVEAFISTADLVIAGDIHLPFQYKHLVYTNNPVNEHFESSPSCGCISLQVEDGKASWSRIAVALPNLIQINTTPMEYELGLVLDPKHFYRIEVTGSAEELRRLSNNEPNVKLQKVPEESVSYVETETPEVPIDLSLDDELIIYMQALTFTEQKIKNMMEVFYGSPL